LVAENSGRRRVGARRPGQRCRLPRTVVVDGGGSTTTIGSTTACGSPSVRGGDTTRGGASVTPSSGGTDSGDIGRFGSGICAGGPAPATSPADGSIGALDGCSRIGAACSASVAPRRSGDSVVRSMRRRRVSGTVCTTATGAGTAATRCSDARACASSAPPAMSVDEPVIAPATTPTFAAVPVAKSDRSAASSGPRLSERSPGSRLDSAARSAHRRERDVRGKAASRQQRPRHRARPRSPCTTAPATRGAGARSVAGRVARRVPASAVASPPSLPRVPRLAAPARDRAAPRRAAAATRPRRRLRGRSVRFLAD
jgi:hypothetical protein